MGIKRQPNFPGVRDLQVPPLTLGGALLQFVVRNTCAQISFSPVAQKALTAPPNLQSRDGWGARPPNAFYMKLCFSTV